VLLRVIVSDGNYDVQGHIDREVAQINWALTHLREKNEYTSQELEGALRQTVDKKRILPIWHEVTYILPIWHEVTYEDVLKYSPALAQSHPPASSPNRSTNALREWVLKLSRTRWMVSAPG
jgi:hypothetical protein